jgi:DNA-binding NarL/FixJ family response regulator
MKGDAMSALRLLVADDHEVVRRGLKALLEAQPGWEVTAEAADGREAVAKTKELKPDVSVLDLSMPLLNGLEATRHIRKASETKVLILTVHDADPVIHEVLDAGAQGYVLKSDAGRDLVAAVEAVSRNKTFFTSKVEQMILDGYLGDGPRNGESKLPKDRRDRLTPRQREIVQLLAEGKSSKEVAVALDLSIKTAETHRANIMRKLNCHCVSDVVRYAIRNRIIEA